MIFFLLYSFNLTFADTTDSTKEIVEKAKEITKDLQNKVDEEEDVPLNDPFAGNEGSNTSMNLETGEERDEMSLYNFKLVGLISGKDHSYISLVNSGGEVITLGLGQYLGKIKLIDLRLTEAIFKKEDKSSELFREYIDRWPECLYN